LPFNLKERVDSDVSFMVNTTLKHLTDGIRPSEASPDTQKQFSRASSAGPYGDCNWKRYLDPAATQSVRQLVNGLDHQEPTVPPFDMSEEWGTAGDSAAGFSGIPPPGAPLGGTAPNRRRPMCRSRWSADSSRTAFSSGGDAASNATTFPLPGTIACHPPGPESESPLTTVDEVPSLPSRDETVA